MLAPLVFVATLALSLALPLAVRPLLVKLGVMDVPNERSSHERPILRGLGLSVLISMALVGGGATAFAAAAAPDEAAWKFLLVVTLGSLCAGLLGFSEDLRGISVPVRSAVLLLIAVSTSIALLWLASTSDLPSNAGLDVAGLPLWFVVVLGVYGVLFVSSYINVANFMDGLNGISGLHGLVAGLAFAAAGASQRSHAGCSSRASCSPQGSAASSRGTSRSPAHSSATSAATCSAGQSQSRASPRSSLGCRSSQRSARW